MINRIFVYLPYYSSIFILLLLILINAWVSDDAYITFTYIDNFINGHGLRFNISERVQGYTHPLWLFVNIIPYYLIGDIFLSSIILSSLISISSVIILTYKIKNSFTNFYTVIFILAFSNIFLDYSTSGLENCLSFLFISIFYKLLNSTKNFSSLNTIICIGIISSLSALNRMDTILFYLASLLFLFIFNIRNFKNNFFLILSLLPIGIWSLFSLVYYGFPFPNTAYAKLSTSLSKDYYFSHGIYYLKDLFFNHTFSFSIIFIGFCITYINIYNEKQEKSDYYSNIIFLFGLIFYTYYIISIGGDFMSGRFWSLPFFLSVCCISKFIEKNNFPKNKIVSFLFILFILSFLLNKKIRTPNGFFFYGIVNEKNFYSRTNNFYSYIAYKKNPKNNWYGIDSLKLKNSLNEKTIFHGNPGTFHYYCGPSCHIIDILGLTDAYIARMPVIYKNPRIGHFQRKADTNYLHFKRTGELKNMTEEKQLYLKHLDSVIKGPIWSYKRFNHIINFNLGSYDYLLPKEDNV